MSRQFIADLQARDNVDEIYRVADKQVRSNRQGNDYLLLQLMDRTGQVSDQRRSVVACRGPGGGGQLVPDCSRFRALRTLARGHEPLMKQWRICRW